MRTPRRHRCYQCGRKRLERLMFRAFGGHWYCNATCPYRFEWRVSP